MRLVVKQNNHLVNQSQFVKGPVYLGRHAQCQIFLPSLSVSRQHGVIFISEVGNWMVKDLHSANKTYLNGKVITEAPLKTGDRIHVADYIIEVDLEEGKGINKLVPLDDTSTSVYREPQLIKRTLQDKNAPAIRMPAHRANDLHQILIKVAHAEGSAETLEVLLEVLVTQFRAGHVWCSFRYDSQGIFDEQGGRTDIGQPFEMKSKALHKLIDQACDSRQFMLLSNVKQEAVKVQAQSAIIVPILSDEGALGVIYVSSRPDLPPFSMSDLDYAMIISINLGIILENF